MKFFKSTLSILIICATSSMFAARLPKGATPAATQPNIETVTTTVSLGSTYPEIFAKIKTMPANQVVDNAGNTLQPAFVKSVVTTPGLSQTEAEALLQAAVNMHATWSAGDTVADNQRNTAKLTSLNSQIMSNAQPSGDDAAQALKRLQAQGPKTLQTAQETLGQMKAKSKQEMMGSLALAEFYNTTTNLLNPYYLEDRIKTIYSEKNRVALLDALRVELLNKMLPEWKKRKINEKTFKNKLNEQITNAFNTAVQKSKSGLAPVELGPITSEDLTVEEATGLVKLQGAPRAFQSGKQLTEGTRLIVTPQAKIKSIINSNDKVILDAYTMTSKKDAAETLALIVNEV